MEPLCVKVAEEHGKNKAAYYEGWKAGYQLNKGRPFDGKYHQMSLLNLIIDIFT